MGYGRAGALSVRTKSLSLNLNRDTNSILRSVTRSYYRGAAGVILVYDITRYVQLRRSPLICGPYFGFSSRDSFLNLSRWLSDARALASQNLVVVLVGNKSDREEDREVEWADASRWAAENGTSEMLISQLFIDTFTRRCAFP